MPEHVVRCEYMRSRTRLSCSWKEGPDTSRVVDPVHREGSGFVFTVSICCNRKKWWSVLIPSTSREVGKRK